MMTAYSGPPPSAQAIDAPEGRDAANATDVEFRPRAILIATDASDVAFGALRIGRLLAEATRARAELVSVVPVLPTPVAPVNPGLVAVPTDRFEYGRRDSRLREVTDQLSLAIGRDPGWPVTVRAGDAAEMIVQTATDHGDDLVVVGLRRHGMLDRVFRDETALNVMRRSPVPVLAVTPLLDALPRRVIVAVDFSRASVRAARLAAQVVARDGVLLLVHVQPEHRERDEATEGARLVYAQGLSSAFSRLRRDLGVPAGVTVEPVVLSGAPAAELLSLADRADASLIAIGSHRRALADRVLLGSVTAAVARDARCSMLVTRDTRVQEPPG